MHLVNSKIAKPPQILFEKHKFEAPQTQIWTPNRTFKYFKSLNWNPDLKPPKLKFGPTLIWNNIYCMSWNPNPAMNTFCLKPYLDTNTNPVLES